MISKGLNWVGRIGFMSASGIAALVLAGQCVMWLRDAQWPSIPTERGLLAFYIGPFHCQWLGVDIVLDFINKSPFTLSIFIAGAILFFCCALLADQVPPSWEPELTKSQ